jgi:hypothetical protein
MSGSLSHIAGQTWFLHRSRNWEEKKFKTDEAAEKFAKDNALKFLPRGYVQKGLVSNAKRKSSSR